jgi:alpha-ketoglutarate-dependent taurine dioxygenase
MCYDAALGELRALVSAMHAEPLPMLLRRADHFEIPALRAAMARAKHLLDHAQGVAVIDALPLDELDRDDARALFWLLGELVGRQVAQKWDGTMLYDVRDTGQKYGYGVRGSYTNVELVFHTDNAFAVCPPHYVGLMCFHPAREGGISRFCSLYAIHERLREFSPEALERLYQPMLWDRQAEHAPGAPKVLRAPMFRCVEGRLITRANVSLVRKGYQVAGQDMDAALVAALEAVESVSRDPSLWFELPIARGHLQYLNNVNTAHYRSDFVDHDDPARKRHLLRSWHREHGRPVYDG